MALSPDSVLYRHSARFFTVFLLFAVWGFWPSYFARLFEQPNLRFHAHGIALLAWCVLLVTQAQLVRTGRRAAHRAFGKLSYVLAPGVILITGSFVHYRVAPALGAGQRLPSFVLYFLALTLLSIFVFAVFYGLAIYWRRAAPVHARFMLCTVFPLFSPITDRLIGAHWPAVAAIVPRIDGVPILPVAGFIAADAIVAGLALWDWAANRRLNVFPAVLAVMVAFHAAVLTLHRVPAWETFCRWFLGLPLS